MAPEYSCVWRIAKALARVRLCLVPPWVVNGRRSPPNSIYCKRQGGERYRHPEINVQSQTPKLVGGFKGDPPQVDEHCFAPYLADLSLTPLMFAAQQMDEHISPVELPRGARKTETSNPKVAGLPNQKGRTAKVLCATPLQKLPFALFFGLVAYCLLLIPSRLLQLNAGLKRVIPGAGFPGILVGQANGILGTGGQAG